MHLQHKVLVWLMKTPLRHLWSLTIILCSRWMTILRTLIRSQIKDPVTIASKSKAKNLLYFSLLQIKTARDLPLANGRINQQRVRIRNRATKIIKWLLSLTSLTVINHLRSKLSNQRTRNNLTPINKLPKSLNKIETRSRTRTTKKVGKTSRQTTISLNPLLNNKLKIRSRIPNPRTQPCQAYNHNQCLLCLHLER